MKSLFLEGLQSAREIVQNKGVEHLDRLILELQMSNNVIENAAVQPIAETR